MPRTAQALSLGALPLVTFVRLAVKGEGIPWTCQVVQAATCNALLTNTATAFPEQPASVHYSSPSPQHEHGFETGAGVWILHI